VLLGHGHNKAFPVLDSCRMLNVLICYAINLVWNSLRRLVKRETVCEMRKLYQTRLCRYYLFKNEYIPYNIICRTLYEFQTFLVTSVPGGVVMPLYGKWAGSNHIWDRRNAAGVWGA
jgi:hypothetical protein